MLLQTISYLIQREGVDSRVTRLLNTTDIHFFPSMNPDGFVKAQVSISGNLIHILIFIKAKSLGKKYCCA